MKETLFIGRNLMKYDQVDSTNARLQEMASAEELPEGTGIVAAYQTAGRGQRGNYWESQSSKNLLLSILLYPKFLHVAEQFILSQAVSLAVRDLVAANMPEKQVKVKWPNDILVNGRKICGILIESTLSGVYLKSSVVGIGLNINEDRHPYPKSTSFSIETGRIYDLDELEQELFANIEARYLQLRAGQRDRILSDYLMNLFGMETEMLFFDRIRNQEIKGSIKGIAPSGKLILETDGQLREYDLKEISFL